MPPTVAENAGVILATMYAGEPEQEFSGQDLITATGLEPHQINDAVTILVENGYAEWMRFLGTAPFDFGYVSITPRGRVEYERVTAPARASATNVPRASSVPEPTTSPPSRPASAAVPLISPLLVPVGSPYGFVDEDWEIVTDRRGTPDRLNVVLGYQFTSVHYDSTQFLANVERMFQAAVAAYNVLPNALAATLAFRPLSAGYGEHLFNEIARDIISADIAVFDTSDLNSNVMIELGVALTWGVRVLVLKNAACPRPPSDISGQTWADYEDSGARFTDPHHLDKLVRVVERAIRKKVRA